MYSTFIWNSNNRGAHLRQCSLWRMKVGSLLFIQWLAFATATTKINCRWANCSHSTSHRTYDQQIEDRIWKICWRIMTVYKLDGYTMPLNVLCVLIDILRARPTTCHAMPYHFRLSGYCVPKASIRMRFGMLELGKWRLNQIDPLAGQ